MAARTNFRKSRKSLTATWLTEGEGDLVGYSLDLVRDAFMRRIELGLLARLPQNDPTGATTPPDDAMAAIGRDRRLVKGINETNQDYAARLLTWLDDRKRAGNPFMLMQQLAAYCGAGPAFRTVDVRGNWYSRDAAGVETTSLNQANWDWDGDAARWSRFWVIIYPNGLWTTTVDDWGDTDLDWGDAGHTWGSRRSGTSSTTGSRPARAV
jgi:hypothetical protein